ncbi:structural maintenance of chromosomes flexible hinge domain-containing protein 1, partial [Plakobranchus ocellatus]
NFNLKVSLPDLDQSHTLKIRLLPGPAVKLNVKPETEIRLENGGSPTFNVEVNDAAGNLTSGGKLNVIARFTGASNLPSFSVDCSSTGSAVLTGKPITIKNLTGEKKIFAQFDIQGVRNMKALMRSILITPSQQASIIKLFYLDSDKKREITPGQVIKREAGSTINTLCKFNVFC